MGGGGLKFSNNYLHGLFRARMPPGNVAMLLTTYTMWAAQHCLILSLTPLQHADDYFCCVDIYRDVLNSSSFRFSNGCLNRFCNGFAPLTYNRSGLLAQYFLPEFMHGQLNVTNSDEF